MIYLTEGQVNDSGVRIGNGMVVKDPGSDGLPLYVGMTFFTKIKNLGFVSCGSVNMPFTNLEGSVFDAAARTVGPIVEEFNKAFGVRFKLKVVHEGQFGNKWRVEFDATA